MVMKDFNLPIWTSPQGEPLACKEKIKVLNENLLEIREFAQEALEDAILMGGDEKQFHTVLQQLIASIRNPYSR